MMKKLVLISILLTGCTTVPVSPSFPDAPEILMEKCQRLKTLEADAKLSGLMITVTENYMRNHECARKLEALQEWVRKQQEIYDKASKK